MDLQLTAAVLLVAGSVVYLVRVGWRTWKGTRVGCGKGACSCHEATDSPGQRNSTETLISSEDLILRRKE